MSRFLQIHLSCVPRVPWVLRVPLIPRVQHLSFPSTVAILTVLCVLAVGGCGEVACPEPLSDVDGTCQKLEPVPSEEPEPSGALQAAVERCDGVDNDGDTKVDEDWPGLGVPCGEGGGVGECVRGAYVCAADGLGVVCEGAVGPSDELCDGKDDDCDGIVDNGPEEICDGKDNDCDGLVDEGVLSIKGEVFDDRASVTAVENGFAVTRLVGDQLRVETYDTLGNRTGYHDSIDRPSKVSFLDSDSEGGRVLVALGQYSFYVVDVYVAADLVPIILDTQELHGDWRQDINLGVYAPPYQPRVLASPSRFLGYRDLVTFALNPFASADLLGLQQAPTLVPQVPIIAVFDAAGPFLVWEQDSNLRAGWLRNDGVVVFEIDAAHGHTPGIALGKDGPGLVYLQDGTLRLSELNGLTMQCRDGGFCNEAIDAGVLQGEPTGPTALAFDAATDTWFVAAGTQLLVLGRGPRGAVVEQAQVRDVLGDVPNRIDVAVSGGTAAVVQAARNGDSALTFLGCF